MTTFDQRQQDRRSAGRIGTAALLERVEVPPLRDYAEWLVDAPGPVAGNPLCAAAELRGTIAAVRVLAYLREAARWAVYLADNPGDPRARLRVGDLAGAVRALERRFPGSVQRARSELERPDRLPARQEARR